MAKRKLIRLERNARFLSRVFIDRNLKMSEKGPTGMQCFWGSSIDWVHFLWGNSVKRAIFPSDFKFVKIPWDTQGWKKPTISFTTWITTGDMFPQPYREWALKQIPVTHISRRSLIKVVTGWSSPILLYTDHLLSLVTHTLYSPFWYVREIMTTQTWQLSQMF